MPVTGLGSSVGGYEFVGSCAKIEFPNPTKKPATTITTHLI